MFHGNALLHGWIIGDATYYTLELPLIGIAQLIFGLGVKSAHVASATTFFLVVAFAVSLAVTGSRGLARVARCGVTVAVLTMPLLVMAMLITLEAEPDHAGTSVFLLASALVIERRPGWKLGAPLLCVILAAGQLGDATVLYVFVPAIVVICGYRLLTALPPQPGGRLRAVLRSADAAMLAGAIASVPLEWAIRTLMRALGGYEMVAPKVKLAAPSAWAHNLAVTWLNIRTLFGIIPQSHMPLGAVTPALGWLCLAVAAAGIGRVAWTWRRASRAEQLLVVAIALNIAIYVVSVMVNTMNYRELSAVLPCSAVLAARALVPAQIKAPMRAFAAVAVAVAVAVALVPVSAAATRPYAAAATGPAPLDGDGSAPLAPVIGWFRQRGISYALSDYFVSSATTVGSGGKLSVRAIIPKKGKGIPAWEDDTQWYDPSRYDIRYVVTQAFHEVWYLKAFGQPAATYQFGRGWVVLKYDSNLLPELVPPR